MFKSDLAGVEQPPHPGEVLREDILPSLDLSLSELARHLRISSTIIDDLIAERAPVTVDLAQRLSEAFGQSPRYWLALQMQFDLYRATLAAPVGISPVLAARPKPTFASRSVRSSRVRGAA